MIRRSALGANVPNLGSYALFSAALGASLSLPDGKVFLKAGVLALASAFPNVPAAMTGNLNPLVQVSELGSGGCWNSIALDPTSGLPLLLSDSGGGALAMITGLASSRANDVTLISGSSGSMTGSGYTGIRTTKSIVHKGELVVGFDPTLSTYAGSIPVWARLGGTTWSPTANGTNIGAAHKIAAFASNPAGNLVAISGAMGSNSVWYAAGVNNAATAALLPALAQWTCAAFGSNIFVALATGGMQAASSPDGVAWTSRALPSAAAWSAVASSGALFVAVASGSNKAATSTDGITWTARTLPAVAVWSAVSYSSTLGLWCAVAAGGAVAATSPDGINWTQRALPAMAGWADVKWCPYLGAFIACASDGRAAAAFSADGITWTAKDLPRVVSFASLVAGGGTTLYAFETGTYPGGMFTTAKSTDSGATWTYYKPNIKIGASSSMADSSIRFVNGKLTCIARRDATSLFIWQSADGITWTQTTPATPYEVINPRDIAWNGSAYVLVSQYVAGNSEHSGCLTSPDLVTWTHRALNTNSCQWFNVITAGSVFLALGSTGFPASYIARSTDNGATWTQVWGNSGAQGSYPLQAALHYDAARDVVGQITANAAWAIQSFDKGLTWGFSSNYHFDPTSAATLLPGGGGTWTGVTVTGIQVVSGKLGALAAGNALYAYAHGYSLIRNFGSVLTPAQGVMPVQLGGAAHFTDGARLLKLDPALYIDNTKTASEGGLSYYLRVK